MTASNPTPVQRLSADVSDLPLRVQTASKRGFKFAATLSDAVLEKVTDLVLREVISGGGNVSNELLSKETGIPEEDASRLAVPVMVLIGLITQYNVTSQEFVNVSRGILYDEPDEQIVLRFIEKVIPSRTELVSSAARSRLANSVLPSLSQINMAVDVRLGFTEDRIDRFVPVVVLRLETDIDGQEILVQLGKADVEILIEQLSTAKRQMAAAEELLHPILQPSSERKKS